MSDDNRPGDGVTQEELERELQRLREAIELLASCMGTHLINHKEKEKLKGLLRPRVLG